MQKIFQKILFLKLNLNIQKNCELQNDCPLVPFKIEIKNEMLYKKYQLMISDNFFDKKSM